MLRARGELEDRPPDDADPVPISASSQRRTEKLGRPAATSSKTTPGSRGRGSKRVGGRRVEVNRQGLRHSHAVDLWREGIDVYGIQSQLGHAHLGVTAQHLRGVAVSEVLAPITNRKPPMMIIPSWPKSPKAADERYDHSLPVTTWHSTELLCPVCNEWRPSRTATTANNFHGDDPFITGDGSFQHA